MEIKSCSKCERAFAYDGEDLCPKCRYGDDEDFKIVKEYLYDNPGADIKMVSEDTEVEVKKILQYLKEGRIVIAEGSENTALACERCSVAINMGRFCNKCIAKMEKEFSGAIEGDKKKLEEKEGIEFRSSSKKSAEDKMFVADRYKK